MIVFDGREPVELTGNAADATNNRMELQAALEALAYLPNACRVSLYTDSLYLRDGISRWLPKWEQRNWKTTAQTDVKNQELWKQLGEQIRRHAITWHWTRGHSGDALNERADMLAKSVIEKVMEPLPLEDSQAIHIFTAVSYSTKTRKGSWAAMLRYREHSRELSGSEPDTSGNRLHIRAAIEGLKTVRKAIPIHVYTVSDYLKDGASRWVHNWRRNHWLTTEGNPVRHHDLWKELANLSGRYSISWHVVSKSDLPEAMQNAKALSGRTLQSDQAG